MKLVREHINEKFSEKGDSIRDMGIGLFEKNIDFSSEKDALNYVISIIPLILDKPEIPKDIINQDAYWIKDEYWKKINNYIYRYISINGEPFNSLKFSSAIKLANELKKMGFKMSLDSIAQLNNFRDQGLLTEKFSEKGDPVKDMSIGTFKKKINFSTEEEMVDFIIGILPDILDMNEIPKDIINENNHIIRDKYFTEIIRYIEDYLSNNEKHEYLLETNILLMKKLYDMGFEATNENKKRIEKYNCKWKDI